MSDQTNIFNESAQEQTQVQEPSTTQDVKPSEASPSTDPYGDLLKTITTETGVQKYGTVSDALNSIPHAQQHIKTLEGENSQIKEQLTAMQQQMEKMSKMEDVLAQLSAKKESEQPSESFGEQQIMELIQSQMSQAELAKVVANNQKEVAQTLSTQFGDPSKAEAAYVAKAQELGVDVNFLNDMAAKSPAAVLSFFKGTESKVPSKSLEGSVNTQHFNDPAPAPKGRNPMLAGTSTKDLLAAWERVGNTSND